MKVTEISLSEIKPYWRNPRNNEPAIEAVKESISMYGFNQPIVVDAKKVIIAGHTRYKALLELGWQKAPCVIADISSDQAKAYRIADNKTNELAEWDLELLIPELREIGDEMQIFFPDENLEVLLHDAVQVKGVTAEEVENVQTQMESKFEDSSAEVQNNYVEITCPHCAEEFFVDRSELNRQPGAETPE